MSATTLLLITLGLGLVSFTYGRSQAYRVAKSGGGIQSMHSLPGHYGMMVAMWCALPAFAVILGWKLLEPLVVSSMLDSAIPQTVIDGGPKSIQLYKNDLGNLVDSDKIATITSSEKQAAAQRLADLRSISSLALVVLALATAMVGAVWALRKIRPDIRARHTVERVGDPFLPRQLCVAGDSDNAGYRFVRAV